MLLTDLVVIGWHFTIPRGQRLFHQLGAIILTTATIAYFSMASNLGSTPIATEFAYLGYPIGTLRQIWVSFDICLLSRIVADFFSTSGTSTGSSPPPLSSSSSPSLPVFPSRISSPSSSSTWS